jgi:adenylate cyclase
VQEEKRIEFRIGIHQGDIVVDDGDIFGDGVNIAARLEGLAEPGGICVSARVQEDAAGKLNLDFEDLGKTELKNIARPVRSYRVRREDPPTRRGNYHCAVWLSFIVCDRLQLDLSLPRAARSM